MKKNPKTEKVTLAIIAKTLEGVVTKTDLVKTLEGVATKTDLGKLSRSIDDLTVTVDNLAIATNKGFENTVSKEEFGEFKEEMVEFTKKTSLTLFNIDGKLQTVDQRLDSIEKTLEPLMLASGAMQRELREHERRLSHVERKVGVVTK